MRKSGAMKRLIALILALFVFWPLASEPSAGRSPRQLQYVQGEILVKFRPGISVDPIQLADQMLPIRGAQVSPVSAADRLYLVHFEDHISVEEAVARAEQDPWVEYAEPNYLYSPADTIPNDQFFNQMWGLFNDGSLGGRAGADIGAPRAWDITTGSDQVVVAITDTGVDLSHPDLVENAWVNPGEIPGNGVDDDGNGFVDDINGWNFFSGNGAVYDPSSDSFHGTHVAGTIGAIGNNGVGITGVAWRVKLMALKFIGRRPDGRVVGSTADAIRAINYAIDQKVRGTRVVAINASWAGSSSMSLREAIIAAGEAGIVFVSAAGNGGSDSVGDDMDDPASSVYPAAWTDLKNLISVAALDRTDRLASFSNYGHVTVSVGAPGVSILSTLPGGGYGFLSGTSMAAPHVTGIVALLAAQDPDMTPAKIRQRIINTAQPVLALASRTISSGRASAYNALTNTVPPPDEQPAIARVSTTKKAVIVDGLGFPGGASILEINGQAVGPTLYDDSYMLANGSFSRIIVRLGKPGIREKFPKGVPVALTVLNANTGRRSESFIYIRP
jgi:subtilisin family serine protease